MDTVEMQVSSPLKIKLRIDNRDLTDKRYFNFSVGDDDTNFILFGVNIYVLNPDEYSIYSIFVCNVLSGLHKIIICFYSVYTIIIQIL